MTIVFEEQRKKMKESTIKDLQQLRYNKAVDSFDLNFVNNLILAKLRGSNEISDFNAEILYYKNLNDEVEQKSVLFLFRQRAPFVKGLLSENQIKTVLSRLENPFIRGLLSTIISESITIDPLVDN